MKRVTIQEIASELSLSRNTVSKALSGNDEVAPETRLLVVKTAKEMGYPLYKINMSEPFETSSREFKNKSILILIRRETSNFWNRIILGISDIMNSKHISMRLHVVNERDEADKVIPFEETDKIAGIIVLSVFEPAYIDAIMEYDIPMVFFDAPVRSELYLKHGDVILSEGFNSMRQITEHLIDKGMKRFSFIGDCTYCRTISDRFNGFLTALYEHNVSYDRNLMFTDHMPNRYYDYNEVSGVIDSLPYIPDAIICCNDDVAKDVYKKMGSLGLCIPKDIVVTGFDNSEAAQILTPSLTTVAVHNQSMGKRLAMQLLYRIDNITTPKEMIYVSTELCINDSSRKMGAKK